MLVGVLQLELHLPGHRSLKDKRQVLRRVKDRVWQSFRIACAEVGHQEVWQRTTVGCAVVGPDDGDVRGILRRVVRCIEDLSLGEILRRRVEVIRWDRTYEDTSL